MKHHMLIAAGFLLCVQMSHADDGWLETRNEWVRIVEWDRLAGNLSASDRQNARVSLQEADDRWKAGLPPAPKPVAAASVPAPTKVRRRVYPRQDIAARPASVNEVIVRAEAARSAGQLENALRLYRIADRMSGGNRGSAEADSIEREISAQPAR